MYKGKAAAAAHTEGREETVARRILFWAGGGGDGTEIEKCNFRSGAFFAAAREHVNN